MGSSHIFCIIDLFLIVILIVVVVVVLVVVVVVVVVVVGGGGGGGGGIVAAVVVVVVSIVAIIPVICHYYCYSPYLCVGFLLPVRLPVLVVALSSRRRQLRVLPDPSSLYLPRSDSAALVPLRAPASVSFQIRFGECSCVFLGEKCASMSV